MFFGGGAWGVSLFFVLSGFVMYYAYCERDLGTNLLSRIKFTYVKIKKLYLLHILTMFLALFLAIYSGKTFFDFVLNGIKVVLNVCLVQAWIPRVGMYFSLNGVAWYLSVCTFLYFMFPVVLKIIKGFNRNRDAIVCIVWVLIIQVTISFGVEHIAVPAIIDNFPKWTTYIFPIYRLGDFVIGCCLGYIYVHRRKIKISIWKASVLEGVVILASLGACLVYHRCGDVVGEGFRYTLIYTLPSIGIVYLTAVKKGFFSKAITNRPMIFLGDISAYAFLIHQIVIRYMDIVMRTILKIDLSIWWMALICFLITFILSIIWMGKIVKKGNISRT